MNRKSLLLLLLSCFAFLAVSSPEQRTLTDAQGFMVSAANPKAAPVPIGDLFYTRTVNGGAWSPDGQRVVFTTNLTGRPAD